MSKTIANDRARIDAQHAAMMRDADAKAVKRLQAQGYLVQPPTR